MHSCVQEYVPLVFTVPCKQHFWSLVPFCIYFIHLYDIVPLNCIHSLKVVIQSHTCMATYPSLLIFFLFHFPCSMLVQLTTTPVVVVPRQPSPVSGGRYSLACCQSHLVPSSLPSLELVMSLRCVHVHHSIHFV